MRSRTALKHYYDSLRLSCSDLRFEVHENVGVLVEGDLVALRTIVTGTHTGDYYGIPPTGRAVVSTFVAFDRVVDGKLVENWTVFDNYDLMRQLGILPASDGAVR